MWCEWYRDSLYRICIKSNFFGVSHSENSRIIPIDTFYNKYKILRAIRNICYFFPSVRFHRIFVSRVLLLSVLVYFFRFWQVYWLATSYGRRPFWLWVEQYFNKAHKTGPRRAASSVLSHSTVFFFYLWNYIVRVFGFWALGFNRSAVPLRTWHNGKIECENVLLKLKSSSVIKKNIHRQTHSASR